MSTPRLLSNRYELGETLGYGGMSEVHKGRDVRLGRDVAVKVLRADLARDPQFQERFRREAQNAAALNHPAIVAVYDTGETKTEHGSLPYIVMEYVDGRTLRDIVKTQGPLSGKRSMEVMADVCAALDFSHRHGIIHRDVKPANVMITKTGAVKVMDFGIARALHDGQAAVTQTAAVIGTAQYLSPEQARGEAVDARSDVYASGCVLFELMTGQPPFTGDSPVAVAYQHVREEPPAPSSVNPQVTPALDSIVLKAMAKGPANRYQSAAEMRADLVRVLSGQRPSAPAVMTAEDRTSIMGNGARTQVVPGRHRPGPVEPEPEYDAYDVEAEEEDERRRKRKKTLTIIGVVIACIAVLALAAFVTTTLLSNNTSTDTGSAALPDVVKQQLPAAQGQLSQLGFDKVATQFVSCPGAPDATPKCTTEDIGKVVAQTPEASSTPINKHTLITLSVGRAADQKPIPDVKGKSVAEATDILTRAGFVVASGQDQVPTDDPALAGKVVSTTPSIGGNALPGSTVTLGVGKAPDAQILPDVTGQTFEAASANITNAGGQFKVVKQTMSSSQSAGIVVKQNPPGNTKQKPGTTVTLFVSAGDQFKMVNISGSTVDQAKSKLAQLGWTGSFNETDVQSTDPTTLDQISEFDPAVGTEISKGATINIRVNRLIVPTTTTRTR